MVFKIEKARPSYYKIYKLKREKCTADDYTSGQLIHPWQATSSAENSRYVCRQKLYVDNLESQLKGNKN